MPQSSFQNFILKSLASEDFALLRPHIHRVELSVKTCLEKADRPIDDIYFPEKGIASVVASMRDLRQTEVGVIGYDGMTGTALILGQERSPNATYMQVAGSGWCLPADILRSALSKSLTLAPPLLRYAHAFLVQASRTALVNSQSNIEERLARWLLMVHDRTDGDRIYLTHEFMATMLGTRRPGVTVALQMLEYRGLVQAKRGEITIIDRAGLIVASRGAYAEDEQRLFRSAYVAYPEIELINGAS